jgi:hypothetical protein
LDTLSIQIDEGDKLTLSVLLSEYLFNTRSLLAIKLLENCEAKTDLAREAQLQHLPINQILAALTKK